MEIEEALIDKGIKYRKAKAHELLIQCTSGLHDDSNPSLRYDLQEDVFHCFGCGFKGGRKKFLESIGIEVTDVPEKKHETSYKIKKLRRKFESKLLKEEEIRLPAITYPYNVEFKGINLETIQEFGAFTTPEFYLEDYICFPIYQYGKLRFIEGRYKLITDDKSIIKYKRKPDGAKSVDIVFPLDKIGNTDTVILVEGLFDMLNMWQYGYHNVLCIFGTNNFTKETVEVLKDKGIRRAIILMDGDLAGYNASIRIRNVLDEQDVEPIVIDLPNGKDPGSLNKASLEKVFERYEI